MSPAVILHHQCAKKYSYNWKNTPDGDKLFKRQVEKNGNGRWKYVGDWVLAESMYQTVSTTNYPTPRKRKIPPPIGRDENGRLLMPHSDQNLTEVKELEKYNSFCDYIRNITDAIDGIEDCFPKNILIKHRDYIVEKKNQFWMSCF